MTARKILLATFGIAMLSLATAEARPRPNGHINGRSFEANKTFGLGLELGAPTGVTGKYFLSGDRALDFGVGDIYNNGNRYGLHVYGDYLFHPVSLVSTEAFELPLYIGLGGRIWDFQDRGPAVRDDAIAVGFRVPVGVSFDFNNVPLDAFIQVVPVLDVYSGYQAHDLYLDLDFSIGVRYWFN
ncbi:MAG: hypothetical protein ABIY55_18195 [Kofleriaceae bacterium]